ncbi:SOS response-associated peptidase family protein [Mesorhizobium sp. B1-1-8]|uniref:SOS response-associated peptidase family protein n=1 Tax=Mesorhizobium sp. B1-1-8 TaxID=2589976 RepID=UPI00112609EE|nr:SOS response-associated peptidase family protein [Mesorhizobium sp. B1-1-8]UCI05233.1 SOS response-associated peptidase family protein [Mesorhizobium sp. B1-1-8]
MNATAFDTATSLDDRRVIIKRDGSGVEMVELIWGLQPREPDGRPFTVVRPEGRTFPTFRCLIPASEFRHRSRGKHYRFMLADGDWFYFAGIWRPAMRDWPEAYAILTVKANEDIAPYHDRQMVVLRREERMAWLDLIRPESVLLQPFPKQTYRVDEYHDEPRQEAFAL